MKRAENSPDGPPVNRHGGQAGVWCRAAMSTESKAPRGWQRFPSSFGRHLLPNPCAALFASVLFFVLCTTLPSCAAELGEPDPALFGKTIREISIASDMPIDQSHYVPYLGIKPGERLTRTGVKGAIQSLYETGRFSQIVVEGFAAGEFVDVRFEVRNNYYFNKFLLEGNINLNGRSLWELVPLPTGQRFTKERLEDSEREVLKFVREKGFYLAKVKTRTIPDEKRRQVDTVFEVEPGALATISSIEIKGVPPQDSTKLRKIFRYQQGKTYDRSRLNGRLASMRRYFTSEGYLAATVQVNESFNQANNTVGLSLTVDNYGKMRVVVEGFKIDKDQLRRLLPVLTGEGINPDILEEGANNLKEYLENKGYSEADVQVSESLEDSGVRVFRYKIVPSHRFKVSYVRFKGNVAFPEHELLATLEMQRGSAYSVSRLDSDVETLKSLYQSHGYLTASIIPLIEPDKSGKKVGIVYACEEGPIARVLSLDIKGNEIIPTADLMKKVKLAPGKPYSPSLVEEDRQALLAAYNDMGFLQAQVTVQVGKSDKDNLFPVGYEIHEGTRTIVDQIIVLGNEHTHDSVISNKIKLRTNEPLSMGKLLQTQQGLYGMGVFDQVRVSPQNPESTAPFQDVIVRLQESKRFTIRYGFGYQEREKLRGTLEFTHLNILGLGRRADIRFRGSSIEQQAILSLQQPQFRAIPVDSYFTFSALQRKDVSFNSKRLSLSYQYSHPFGTHTWGMLRYNFKNVRISSTPLQLSELGREDQPVNLSTFSVAFINDTRDDYLDPSKGFFSSTDFGITPGWWSDHKYFSFFTQNSYYRKLPQSLLLASSFRLGLAHPLGGLPDLPISERFFAGGSSSLRGFDTDYAGPLDPTSNLPVGGNALFVGSVEMRVPVYRVISIAGFYDSGNVFRNVSDIRISDFSHTVGAGLRIKTPFGPLRADYGYNLNLSSDLRQRGLTRGHFFITIGPPF
jgi:outer membrane protein insertion porin family